MLEAQSDQENGKCKTERHMRRCNIFLTGREKIQTRQRQFRGSDLGLS